jgi:diguanylate cyclase (GGDEF)-like protein
METVLVSTVLGALLLFAWFQERTARALLWWGPTCLLAALGMALLGLRDIVGNFVSIGIANAILILAAGTMWCGAREFEGKKTNLGWVVAPPLVWIVACQTPAFDNDVTARIVLNCILLAPFIFAAAFTFWSGRAEHLVSRWAVVAVLMLHGISHLVRIVVVSLVAIPNEADLIRSGYFGCMAISLLVFIVAFAFTLLALTKERAERHHRIAASTDSLTGLLNRRALFAARDRLADERADTVTAVLVFDLDRFKQINDRFGHPVGDRVLQLFAVVARGELRACDLLGRIGGEEFAAFLPGCDVEQALRIGERVRQRFADAARQAALRDFLPTVSVGVAMSNAEATDSSALIIEADRAVYRAKKAGRNCVRGAETAAEASGHSVASAQGKKLSAAALAGVLTRVERSAAA